MPIEAGMLGMARTIADSPSVASKVESGTPAAMLTNTAVPLNRRYALSIEPTICGLTATMTA
ncbi:hypothetical protein D9M72_616290 [compost metagenome]